MLGELVPQGGGDPIPLLKPKLLIGRRDSCDITLRFPNVSSHHCELELRNGYWYILDLGSSNGVKVNGVRVEEKFLAPGDEVSVAKHHFKIQYEADMSAPPPDVAKPARPRNEAVTPPVHQPGQPLPSLMELAGLERRPRPATRPAPPKPKTPEEIKEDDAMNWLQGEN